MRLTAKRVRDPRGGDAADPDLLRVHRDDVLLDLRLHLAADHPGGLLPRQGGGVGGGRHPRLHPRHHSRQLRGGEGLVGLALLPEPAERQGDARTLKYHFVFIDS